MAVALKKFFTSLFKWLCNSQQMLSQSSLQKFTSIQYDIPSNLSLLSNSTVNSVNHSKIVLKVSI